MPELEFITRIPGVQIYDVSDGQIVVLRGRLPRPEAMACPRCEGQALRIKATLTRRLKHGSWVGKLVWLQNFQQRGSGCED